MLNCHRPLAILTLVLVLRLLGGCGDATGASGDVSSVGIAADRLAAPAGAVLEAWLEGDDGWYRLGTLSAERARFDLTDAVGVVRRVAISVRAAEEPGDAPVRLVLQGEVRGGVADLSPVGALTRGAQELREYPGQFTIFAPSTGHLARYPHHEESGVWLMNTQPRETEQDDAWVRLTPLDEGWFYEHWVVRDLGSEEEIWLSNGKFRPNRFGVVIGRDHTGWGPFSGVADYETAGEEEVPGADYYGNPLGLPFPEALELPLDLTEQSADGLSRWHYVITAEPSSDWNEPLTTERPFPVMLYVEPFGTGGPGEPRALRLRTDLLPRGTAEVR